jgi:hypothetical protein
MQRVSPGIPEDALKEAADSGPLQPPPRCSEHHPSKEAPMSITPMLRGRRLAANGLIALVVAVGAGAGVALANDGGGKGGGAPASTAKAPSPAGGDVPHQFIDAVQALVANGTINQSQADRIEAQIRTGSMDSEQFVQSGLVTQAQMDAINSSLRAVKQSLAQAAGGPASGDRSSGDGAKQGASAAGKSPGGDVPQIFINAVQSRVTDGTISQSQADAIEAQVRTGSIDPQQIVASGVVTQAQMDAVSSSLRTAKESLAGG